MNICFQRRLTQKYRSILHFIDPLIEAGHDLTITINNIKFSLQELKSHPHNVNSVRPSALKYMAENFGMEIKNWDKVKYTTNKKHKCDLKLDSGKRRVEGAHITLPHMKPVIVINKELYLTGNPLCEMIREREQHIEEVPGRVLLIHPGGGRGFVSPVKKKYSKDKVVRNNIQWLRRILDELPQGEREVVIKTHPFPYHKCTKISIEKSVLPVVQKKYKHLQLSVVENDLISEICKAEWVLLSGSSTAFWLIGSPKKWLNITGLARFGYSDHRDKKAGERGGGVDIRNVNSAMVNYKREITPREKMVYELPATDIIMEIINGFDPLSRRFSIPKGVERLGAY